MHIIFCFHSSLFEYLFHLAAIFFAWSNSIPVSNTPDSLIPT